MLTQSVQASIYSKWAEKASASSAALSLGVPRSTVRDYYKRFSGTYPNWLEGVDLKSAGASHPYGFESRRAEFTSLEWASYCYLLGLYLGDGHIVASKKTWILRIYQTAKYTNLVSLALGAMKSCWPKATVWSGNQGPNCTLCLVRSPEIVEAFPQHGPGRKHLRPIVLADWQVQAVRSNAAEFLRGLIHSDGCRSVRKIPKNKGGTYLYPFYGFSNRSSDILNLCFWVSDLLGLSPTRSSQVMISFAKRKDVSLMDTWIGPKS